MSVFAHISRRHKISEEGADPPNSLVVLWNVLGVPHLQEVMYFASLMLGNVTLIFLES